MIKIFLIDNYDSFTYNLLYYLEELGCEVTVKRNDKFELDEIRNFDAILISPGPGIPQEAGKIIEVIRMYYDTKNIFGVCNNILGLSLDSCIVCPFVIIDYGAGDRNRTYDLMLTRQLLYQLSYTSINF